MNHPEMKSFTSEELLFRLFVRLAQDLRLHWRDVKTLSTRYKNEGLPFLTRTLPILSKALVRGLGCGTFVCPSNFKRLGSGNALPAFLGSLFSRVFSRDGTVLENACQTSIRFIRQFCEFAYKAKFGFSKKQESDVIRAFLAVEEGLSQHNEPYEDSSRKDYQILNAFIREMFSDFPDHVGNLNFRNGPGSVANVDMYRKFSSPVSYHLPSSVAFHSSFYLNYDHAMTVLGERSPTSYRHGSYFRGYDYSRNCAKVILVEKDSRGPRLISAEPYENQWVQQGIASYMINRIEEHPLTRGQVNFTDQSINQQLVILGSLTREFSFLDLKEASDRLRLVSVKAAFQDTLLLLALLASRSSFTRLPDSFPHEPVFLRKHAPMGSALCFPVMAITIYFLIVSRLINKYRISVEQACKSVFVYGDDIVVRTEYATDAIEALEDSYLKVNVDKSFVNSHFAESCGVDAYKGIQNQPVRIRNCQVSPDQHLYRIENYTCVIGRRAKHFKKFCSLRGNKDYHLLKDKPQVLVSLLETANLLSLSGYKNSSQFLYDYCEEWLGVIPYGTPRSQYLCRVVPPELESSVPEMNIFHMPQSRWKREDDLQRYPLGVSLRAWAIKPKKHKTRESSYHSHFLRIQGMVGKSDWSSRNCDPDFSSPAIGQYDHRGRYSLKLKTFCHYSMS